MTGVTVVDVRGHVVAVEAHVGRGLPSLTLTKASALLDFGPLAPSNDEMWSEAGEQEAFISQSS